MSPSIQSLREMISSAPSPFNKKEVFEFIKARTIKQLRQDIDGRLYCVYGQFPEIDKAIEDFDNVIRQMEKELNDR